MKNFAYDARDNRTSATKPDGVVLSSDYDGLSRLTRIASGDIERTYAYDAQSNLLAANDNLNGEAGPDLGFTYDGENRLATASVTNLFGGGVQNNVFTYGYDALDRRASMADSFGGNTAYAYDPVDRLTQVTTPQSEVFTQSYDLAGRLLGRVAPNTTTTDRAYEDGTGRLMSQTQSASDTAFNDFTYDYTDRGNIAEIADRTTRLDNNAERIAELFSLIADKESRIATNAARITELEALSADKTARINTNAARITELGALVTDKESRITTNAARVTELDALILDKQSRIESNSNRINELTVLIAADEAELATLDPVTDAVRIALLTDRIAARSASIDTLSSRNGELSGLIIDHQTRVTELTTRNAELAALITDHETRIAELTTRNTELVTLRDGHDTRAAELTTRNAELTTLNTAHETRITELEDRNFTLAEQRAKLEAELAAAQAGCDTVAAEGLYYLHADHLGRPQFATDTSGAVVWDMGGDVTPFGDSVNLAGAFAQQLMFPGQYADLETGDAADNPSVTLSHNWRRTYDPTLGRYLQSDPIGLAGGLNRFAYVGGSPVGMVDILGLDYVPPGDVGHGNLTFGEHQKIG